MKNWFWPEKNAGKKVLYFNARIIDPINRLDNRGHILTIGDKIVEHFPIGHSINEIAADDKIDCGGHALVPGLVDIHVHFREPGFEHKETIETGSCAAVAGGVTTVVCQPNTNPRIASPQIIKYVLSRPSYTNLECYAAISGLEDERITDMQLLHDAGACGFTNDGLPVMNSLIMKQAFRYSKALNVPIAQHAEDCNYTGCMNEGRVSEALAVSGNPNISESMIIARDIQILQTVEGAHYHVLHVSAKESLEFIRQAKKSGMNVTCEVAPHHFLLTDEQLSGYNCLGKVSPPLRTEEDRLAMIDGIKSGIIDCIASDHAPHESASKNTTLEKASFGMVGVETMLPLTLTLYHNRQLSLMDTIGLLTYRPAQIIGKPIGRLSNGSVADLTIIDLDAEWTIRNASLSSLSKNSPYDGLKVKGRVKRTVVGGATVFTDAFQ